MLTKLIDSIREQIKWDFEQNLFNSSIQSLLDFNNPIRYNTFAFSFRELIRHIFSKLALDDEVLKCSWYKNETNKENGISRKQRMLYAIKGGLSDQFAETELDIDLKEISGKMIKVIDSLNKYTHVEEGTFNTNSQQGDKIVYNCLSALNKFLTMIEDFRNEIILTYEDRLYSSIDEAMINDAIQELDELSTHYYIECAIINNIEIKSIDSNVIKILLEGTVIVEHQYGSERDNRNGDGVKYTEGYPYKIATSVDVRDPLILNISTEEISVDNSKFYE